MESSVATPEAPPYAGADPSLLETSYSPSGAVEYNVTFEEKDDPMGSPADGIGGAGVEQYRPRSSSEVAKDEIDSEPQAQLYIISEDGIFPADKVDLPTEKKSPYELVLGTNEQNKALQDIKTSEEPQQIEVLFTTKVNSQNQTEKHYSVQEFIPKGYDKEGRLQFEISSTLRVEVCKAEEEESAGETKEPETDASQSDALTPDSNQDPKESTNEKATKETTSEVLDNDGAPPATTPLNNSGTEATTGTHYQAEPQTDDEILEETTSRQIAQNPDEPSPTGGSPTAITPTEETGKATQGVAEPSIDTPVDATSSHAQLATIAKSPQTTSRPDRKKSSGTPALEPAVAEVADVSTATIAQTEQKPQTVAPLVINEASRPDVTRVQQESQPLVKPETVLVVAGPVKEQAIKLTGDNRQQVATPLQETAEPQADSPKLAENKVVDKTPPTMAVRTEETTEETTQNPIKATDIAPSILEFLETAYAINQTPPPMPVETIPRIPVREQEVSPQAKIKEGNGDLTITIKPANEILGVDNTFASVSFEGLSNNTSHIAVPMTNTLPHNQIDTLASSPTPPGHQPAKSDLVTYFTPLDKKRQKNKPTTLSPAGATV